MKLDRYYYITSLPPLGELGSKPPIGFVELREYLGDDPDRRELVGSLFLLDDLLQREAYLAGELKEVAPAVLSEKQVRNRSPLPGFLVSTAREESDASSGAMNTVSGQATPAGQGGESRSADKTWEAYFRHVADLARELKCGFLAAWVRHEVALRNALVSVRARRLGLDETDYLVAADLAEDGEETTGPLSDWENAATPLAGHRALIRTRWTWLAEHDSHFTFRDDELAAYALRLTLLEQWRRVMGEDSTKRHLK
jgi:hypothetical protein